MTKFVFPILFPFFVFGFLHFPALRPFVVNVFFYRYPPTPPFPPPPGPRVLYRLLLLIARPLYFHNLVCYPECLYTPLFWCSILGGLSLVPLKGSSLPNFMRGCPRSSSPVLISSFFALPIICVLKEAYRLSPLPPGPFTSSETTSLLFSSLPLSFFLSSIPRYCSSFLAPGIRGSGAVTGDSFVKPHILSDSLSFLKFFLFFLRPVSDTGAANLGFLVLPPPPMVR